MDLQKSVNEFSIVCEQRKLKVTIGKTKERDGLLKEKS